MSGRMRRAALAITAALLVMLPLLAGSFVAEASVRIGALAQDEGQQEDEAGEAAQEDHAEAAQHDDAAAHGEAAEHEGPTWGEYIAKWINFGMLAALLYWLLVVPPAFVIENFEFPGLKVVLRDRAAGIIAAQQLARDQRQDAERRLVESADRLDKVEQEVDELLRDASDDAAQERRRLGAAAMEDAAVIRAAADRDMRTETTRARRELRAHVATLATGIAADILHDNFSGADQERLVREYLDKLGGSVA